MIISGVGIFVIEENRGNVRSPSELRIRPSSPAANDLFVFAGFVVDVVDVDVNVSWQRYSHTHPRGDRVFNTRAKVLV